MIARLVVKDKRCDSGFNCRDKKVDTIEQAIKWAMSVKNRRSNRFIVINNGRVEEVRF